MGDGDAMAEDPSSDVWPCAPVPSVPGDVWHWQLEAMHVVSRVRSDLRARVAHPSVSSASSEDARDGLLLVFEELASNALRHGGGDVRALVVAGPDGWLLDLSDEAPDRPPVPAVDRDPALGGMGLHLVAQLSIDYGWEERPGRTHVWPQRPLRGAARPAARAPLGRGPARLSGGAAVQGVGRSRWPTSFRTAI
jgi:anti-sigma regulatory factor (Ser/Thr protein kinase)